MTSAKSGAVILALGLLACGVSLASVRMNGLGTNLTGLVDDLSIDVLVYPQLNAYGRIWLADVEARESDEFYAYARTPGSLSMACAVNGYLDNIAFSIPSVAVAILVGHCGVGATFTATGLRRMPSGPGFWTRGDTNWNWAEGASGNVGKGTLGIRWTGSGLALDCGVNVARDWWVGFLGVAPDTYVRTHDGLQTHVSPTIRLSIYNGQVCWRLLASYTQTVLQQRLFDTLGNWKSKTLLLKNRAYELTGGLTYSPSNDLVAAIGVRSPGWLNANHTWTWSLLVPLGLEWTRGPVIVRIGAEVTYCEVSEDWSGETIEQGVHRNVYFGLGLRPVERLHLDFVPDMDNAANLRGWSLAVAIDF